MRRRRTTPVGVEHLTLAAMCVAQVMIMLDMTIVNVALPSIQSELDVPPTNLEWIVNAYTLALAALILVGGVLGDRYGRKRVFLLGLAIFTLAPLGTATHRWLSPRTLGMLAVAALGCGAVARWEGRAADPMVPLRLFHDRRLVAVVVTTICAYAALGIVLYMMTLFFQDVRGYSPFDAGLTVVPISLSFGVLAPFAGRAGARFGTSRVIAAGCVAAAASIGAIALTSQNTPYAVFLGPYLLLGVGFAAITPSVAAVAMSAVEAAHSGLAAGIVNAARQLGAVLGIAVFGSVAVSVAERSWNHHAGHAAGGLGQSVAGGQIAEVTTRLGHRFDDIAANAFTSGMRAGLALAALGLLIGAASILAGARPTAPERAPAADSRSALADIPPAA